MARGFFARLWKRYVPVASLGELLDHAGDRVEIQGFADPVAPLEDPLSGERCVAIDYRAWPPSTTIGIDGATAHNGRAYQLMARQAVDFALTEGAITVLVRVDNGEDVGALHDRLLERFGVGLRAETDMVARGARIGVAGRVEGVQQGTSPHRTAPHTIAVVADRFWLVE
ncbi:MAG: hypothetical protein AAF721_36040 [Myxococcota bacterium]